MRVLSGIGIAPNEFWLFELNKVPFNRCMNDVHTTYYCKDRDNDFAMAAWGCHFVIENVDFLST